MNKYKLFMLNKYYFMANSDVDIDFDINLSDISDISDIEEDNDEQNIDNMSEEELITLLKTRLSIIKSHAP